MRDIDYYPMSASNYERRVDFVDGAAGKSFTCFSSGPIDCDGIAGRFANKQLKSLKDFNPQNFLKKPLK